MILVSYDISDDKLRTKFSKYLSKYGYRLQYSVYRIENSDRILSIITKDVESIFSKKFGEADSVFVFQTGPSCKIQKYGYAKNEDNDVVVIF